MRLEYQQKKPYTRRSLSMNTFLPLAAICVFFLPLQAQEEPDYLPTLASAKISAYLERSVPKGAQRDTHNIPATITVETIEPEAKTLELDGKPCTCDLLYITTTIHIDGLPVTFSRKWYQSSDKRKLTVNTPENTSYACRLTPDQLQTMADGISDMDPRDVDEILDNIEPADTPAPEPDIAASLRKEYANKHPEARALPRDGDIRLLEIIRPGYDITLILQDEKAVAMYTPKAGETVELLQNDRYMELIPLPQENHFIIIDHPDGHISRLLLYKIGGLWNHAPNAPVCIFQTPGEYDVQWNLMNWDWKAGTMTVRRTENLPGIGGKDTMDFTIPIR